MARVTVFGAGAAGTALAIHLARKGEDVALWGSRFDANALAEIERSRRHPALSEHLPTEVRVFGEDGLKEAAEGAEIAVLGASSSGARSLARMVAPPLEGATVAVSVAKGLDPSTRQRITEVYAEELSGPAVVAMSGPSLAPELAEGLPTAVALAGTSPAPLQLATDAFASEVFLVETTDDVIGVEICGTGKNVAAIAAGILEGTGQHRQQDLKNARAALFTRAARELADLAEAAGGRRETAYGLAGVGDLWVTALGGRNRLYGEAIGLGADPSHTLDDMSRRGLTVEGAESSKDVHDLASELGLDLPIHEAVHRVVHEGAPADTILEALR